MYFDIQKFFRSLTRIDYLKISLALIIIIAIGLSTISHYGATWDEQPQVEMVQKNIDTILEGRQIGPHSRYHGVIFNLVAEFIFQVKQFIYPSLSSQSISNFAIENGSIQALYERLQVKHIFIFLFSLIAYISVAGIVKILAGLKYSWLGIISLALFPTFWGHSFFNPKDIPYATLFTLATFLGAYVVNSYLQVDINDLKLHQKTLTRYSIGFGILTGLVTGTRIAGCFLLFFLILTHLLILFPQKKLKSFKVLYAYRYYYGLIILYWGLTTILIYPASWYNSLTPLGWFIQALTSMSKYSPWDNLVLFEGHSIPGRSLPWYYLPKTLFLTTPFIFQILFTVGVGLVIIKYKNLTLLQKACIILVFLQILFIPLLAIVRSSTMYDGIRHFIFIIPGIAAIATTAFAWIYEKVMQKVVKIFLITILIISFGVIMVDMIQLHPYEYVYYNRISGGLAKANQRYELDYWGLSIREGIEWLNKQAIPHSKIVVTGPLFVSQMFVTPEKNFKVIHLDNFEEGKEINPDYYLGLHRAGYENTFPECPIIYQVKRQTVPLTTIKQCPSLY